MDKKSTSHKCNNYYKENAQYFHNTLNEQMQCELNSELVHSVCIDFLLLSITYRLTDLLMQIFCRYE